MQTDIVRKPTRTTRRLRAEVSYWNGLALLAFLAGDRAGQAEAEARAACAENKLDRA